MGLYKSTMRLAWLPRNSQQHMKNIDTDPETMSGQGPMRAAQSFLKRRWIAKLPLTVHLCLCLVYVGIFTYGVQDMIRHRHEAGLVYCMLFNIYSSVSMIANSEGKATARGAVEYEVRTIDESIPSDFAGPPSKRTDAAWQPILKCKSSIKIHWITCEPK